MREAKPKRRDVVQVIRKYPLRPPPAPEGRKRMQIKKLGSIYQEGGGAITASESTERVASGMEKEEFGSRQRDERCIKEPTCVPNYTESNSEISLM